MKRGQLQIVLELFEKLEEGHDTPSYIAQNVNLSYDRVATILDRLEEMELITRTVETRDTRGQRIYMRRNMNVIRLTDKGKMALAHYNHLREHFIDEYRGNYLNG